jgi:hypothetical protein
VSNCSVQVSQCGNVKASKCRSVEMSKCPNVQMSKCPNVQMSKCPNVQMSKGPKVQRSKGPKVQRSKGPKVEMSECRNVRVLHAVMSEHKFSRTLSVEEQDRRRLASRSYGLALVRIGRMQGCVRCIKCKQTGGQ